MEWRCEWCGKPHADDDPPCDECGHGTFERAVVRQPAEGPAGNSTTLWVCTECGREHPKHSPPCSRCGSATLERREQSVDEGELVAPGYLDLVTPRYVLGVAVALVLGAVLVLGLLGVVDLPGMDAGVPGSGESYEGIALADVESEYVEQLNEQRATAGEAELQRTAALDEAARSYNQDLVTAEIRGGEPPSLAQVQGDLGDACGDAVRLTPVFLEASAAGSTAVEMGEALATARESEYGVRDDAPRSRTGVDVHVAQDVVVLTQVTC